MFGIRRRDFITLLGRRGGGMADCGAGAAGCDAGDRMAQQRDARGRRVTAFPRSDRG